MGSGCGTLTLGAASLNAGCIVGFEIDEDAIEIFLKNVCEHDLSNIDVVQCDIKHIPDR